MSFEKIYEEITGQAKNLGTNVTDAYARDFAKKLSDAGLTSIEQLGVAYMPPINAPLAVSRYMDNGVMPQPNGELYVLSWINKEKNTVIPSMYQAHPAAGYAGNTLNKQIFRVRFDPTTNLPIFAVEPNQFLGTSLSDALGQMAIMTASVFAPQIGAFLAPAAAVATQAAIGASVVGFISSKGDIESGIKSGLASYLGGVAGSWANGAANSALVGTISQNLTRAAILGGDMEQALVSSLIQAAPSEIIKQFPNFAELPRAAQEAAVAATVDLMRTGGDNLEQIAVAGVATGATDYALGQIDGYNALRPAQQEIVRARISNVVQGADLSNELLQGAIAFGGEAVQYQVNDDKAKKDGWESYDQQQAAKSLYGDKVTPDLYADKQDTTEAEAKQIARDILGREPTEFEYMQLIGLTENDAAQNSDLAAIKYNEADFSSSELIEAYKNLYGKEPTDQWLSENMDLLGRSEAQGKNMLQNLYVEDKNWVTEDEAQKFWKDSGNKGAIPQAFMDELLMSSESAAKANVETYKIRQEDIADTTFNGDGYGSKGNAGKAAAAAGYNNFTYEGLSYTIPPSVGVDKVADRRLVLVSEVLASQGTTISKATDEQYRSATDLVKSVPTGMLGNATLKDIVDGKYQSVSLTGGPFKVEVHGLPYVSENLSGDAELSKTIKDQIPPGFTLASNSDVWNKDYNFIEGEARLITLPDGRSAWVLPETGANPVDLPESIKSRGTIEELETSDPEAWLQMAAKFDQDANGNVSDYLITTANSLVLGAYATGNKDFGDDVKQTLSLVTQAVGEQTESLAGFFADRFGLSYDNAFVQAGKALKAWGADKQSASTKKQEDDFADRIENAKGVLEKLKAIPGAIYDYPGGFTTMVLKEGLQEILPLWAAKSVAQLGRLAAHSANTAVEVMEVWGNGAGETYADAIKMGYSEQDARVMASKVGLQSAAITAVTNGIGDVALVNRVIGGAVKDSLVGITKAGVREGVTEYFDELGQNAAKQYQLTGKVNWEQATTAATIGMAIGAGTTSGIMLGAAINSASVIGQDFSGNDVSYADFMSGDKQVNMSTVNLNTQVGTAQDGDPITLGVITAMPMSSGISYDMVKSGLPPALTNTDVVIGQDEFGNNVTLSEIMGQVTSSNGFDAVYKNLLDITPTQRTATAANARAAADAQTAADARAASDKAAADKAAADAAAAAEARAIQDAVDAQAAAAAEAAAAQAAADARAAADAKVAQDAAAARAAAAQAAAEKAAADAQAAAERAAAEAAQNASNAAAAKAAADAAALAAQKAEEAAAAKIASDAEIQAKATADASAVETARLADEATQANAKTNMASLEKRLSDEIQSAKDIGLEGDAAIQAGLDNLAGKVGTNQADLLTQLGTTANDLKKQFTTDISASRTATTTEIAATKTALETAIADAKASGLKGDAALKAAIDAVAASQQTSAADLLTKLGTTEAGLKSEFEAGLAGVSTEIADTRKALEDAIQAAKDIGLKGDAALQAGIDSVAANLGTTKEALLTQLGATEETLRTEFTSGLAGVSAEVKAAYDSLSAEQKALADQLNQQGADLSTAIQTAQQQTQGQIGALSADVQAKYDALTAEQQSLARDMEQQGMDLTAAIDLAAQQTQQQITNLGTEVDARINELMQQGQTYQQATQQAIGELNTQNQQMAGQIGTQGRTATQADIDAMTQMVNGQMDVDTRYDVNNDNQVTQSDIDFLSQVVSGVNTDWKPQAGSVFAPTGLYGQLAANEAQRQSDLSAQLAREAEVAKQSQISGIRSQAQQVQTAAQQLPQMLQQASTTTYTPIYGAETEYLDLNAPLDFGFLKPSREKQANQNTTKQSQTTKIASGGYIDDLLSEDMTVDELLNLLR